MTTLNDTLPEAARILVEVYRKMSPGRKWLLLGEAYHDARALHAAGVLLRNPAATDRDIRSDWLAVQLRFTAAAASDAPARKRPMQNLHDLREVLVVFDRLGIPYALGGSMASSLYGVGRYTRDADVTAEPFPGKEAAFV